MRKHESVCGFYGFGEGIRQGYREALWQMLRMYDVGGGKYWVGFRVCMFIV